jgi:aerobic C4-dicarboxylate transport protein
MSEARAVTNFSGNAVATLLVGSWTKTVDKDQVNTVLRGDDPFDELTMVDDDHPQRAEEPAQERVPAPA